MLGFSCGYSGEPSEAVQKFEELIQSKDFHQISDILVNGNSAEKFLAIVTLEYLEEVNILQLEQSDKDVINSVKQSRAFVAYCNGCTERHWRLLDELFAEKYISEARNWLTKQIDKE